MYKKPIPVVNILALDFVSVTTNRVRTRNMQGSWYPEISVTEFTTVGVPM